MIRIIISCDCEGCPSRTSMDYTVAKGDITRKLRLELWIIKGRKHFCSEGCEYSHSEDLKFKKRRKKNA